MSATEPSAAEKREMLKRALRERAEGRQSVPLSLGQERMWFLEQLDAGNPALILPMRVRLTGALRREALEAAFCNLIARHEALRAGFASEAGHAVQTVTREASGSIDFIDLESVDASQRETQIENLAREESRKPFDLARAPLLRATLLRLGPQEHALLLTMHHIVSDLRSMLVLVEDLQTLYASEIGENVPLAPPSAGYRHFVKWQRQQLQGERYERSLAYWRETLRGAPDSPLLPTDRPRRQAHDMRLRSARHEFTLPASLAGALWRLARQIDATPFVLLLAALQALLARIAGRDDVIVGVPTINRQRAEFDRLVGFCASTLILRARVREAEPFGDLVDRVRDATLGAFSHEDIPFEKVIEELRQGRERQGAHAPFFQVLFNLVSGSPDSVRTGDLTWKNEVAPLGGVYFDIWLILVGDANGVQGAFLYNADLFDAETIALVAETYRGFLEYVANDSAASLARVALPDRLEALRRRAPEGDTKKPQTLAVAATFTAEPLDEALAYWLEALGLAAQVEFAPYNQVFQQLTNPSSLLARAGNLANVLLVRLEDWRGGEPGAEAEQVERSAVDLVAAIRVAAGRSGAPFLLFLCPPSPSVRVDAERAALYRRVEASIAARLADASAICVVGSREIEGLYPVTAYSDTVREAAGHIPYSRLFFAALGTMLLRKLLAALSRPYKMLIVDCDQTLWRGVCAEDGPEGVKVDAERLSFQRFLLAERDAGMLICLCSKNREADVEAVFARHPDMLLKWEDVAARRVNWYAKSQNVRELAEQLGLGLDSCVFIDDSPLECAEMRAACPEVLTLELPSEAGAIPPFLKHVWSFDCLRITSEDRGRAALYRQHAEREEWREKAPTLREFLDGLNLDVQIREMQPQDLPRVAQLTQRTNQFNTTAVGRAEAEVERFASAAASHCFVTDVTDRFGAYGLVGALFIEEIAENALRVVGFLLSCRALGRGVEHRMLAHVAQAAQARGLAFVEIEYRETGRNEPALAFLDRIPSGEKRAASDGTFLLRASSVALVDFRYDPAESDSETAASRPRAQRKPQEGFRIPTGQVERIAREMQSAEQILAAIDARASERAGAGSAGEPFVEPRTPTERKLAAIWAEVLRIERAGAFDHFFRLGGHSMLGTLLISRVHDVFAVELPLVCLFEAPTLEGLAKAIDEREVAKASDADIAAALAELEGLSEEDVQALLLEE